MSAFGCARGGDFDGGTRLSNNGLEQMPNPREALGADLQAGIARWNGNTWGGKSGGDSNVGAPLLKGGGALGIEAELPWAVGAGRATAGLP